MTTAQATPTDPVAERVAERIVARIAPVVRAKQHQVAAAIALFDAGNTMPFVARYRKEATGGLDEAQLAGIGEQLAVWRALEERRATVLAEIESQGKLTPSLRERIEAADSRTVLEDLYLPYRPKRRTRASVARDKGLQPLAEMIVRQAVAQGSALEMAQPFVGEAVPTPEEALAGARDIVAEAVSDNAEVRQQVRSLALKWSSVTAEKIADAENAKQVYANYYAFSQRVDRMRPHQVLALNRGEKAKVLRVHVAVAERDWRDVVEYFFRADQRSPLAGELGLAIADGVERLLLPAVERDVRRGLTDKAEAHAISVFAANLRALLTQPPLTGRVVLGIDPGLRTGCKVAVVDATGKPLETATIYPHEPRKQWAKSLETLNELAARHGVSLITIGNGTASRETEQLAAELLRGLPPEREARYLIVSEAGASVYSASTLARMEMPDLDVSLRGAVSIARRAQDPLAELVKIDPRSIGVGLYQHDVNQDRLTRALTGVVESVVNEVGVDVNTASPALLTYVAGIGPKLAVQMVVSRDQNGPFRSREALLSVPGLGPKSFEQAAGFLRVRGGAEPLDASAIHPESYGLARAVLQRAGLAPDSSPAERAPALEPWRAPRELAALASELGAGRPTLADILEQLARPGRDPRDELSAPILRSDVLALEDLQPGLRLKGTVRNVVDFGAFVDIGVKQEGLLHRTRLPRGQVLSPGDVVTVQIVSVDAERSRIALAWAEDEAPAEEPAPAAPALVPDPAPEE
jgi:protein Tex